MADPVTTRHSIPYPVPGDFIANGPAQMQAIATQVDTEILTRSYGSSIVTSSETRTNTAYGLLTTPDQVTVVMPTNGLIQLCVQAIWSSTTSAAGRAALFIGANQLKAPTSASNVPVVLEASSFSTVPAPLFTTTAGLATFDASGTGGYSGDVTTGQIVGSVASGGIISLSAAAGTYVVSLQFKSASGGVTVSNRRLWAWSMF